MCWHESYQYEIFLLQVGRPTGDCKKDPEGKPESTVSKVVRGSVKIAMKQGKRFIPKTGNDYLDGAISVAVDVAADQVDTDPHASTEERLKKAGGSIISGVASKGVSIGVNKVV